MVATEPLAAKSRCCLPSWILAATAAAGVRYSSPGLGSNLVVIIIIKRPRRENYCGYMADVKTGKINNKNVYSKVKCNLKARDMFKFRVFGNKGTPATYPPSLNVQVLA